MQLYCRDKAIEFDAICKRVENKIEVLKEATINVDSEQITFQKIKDVCEAQVSDFVAPFEEDNVSPNISGIEDIYQNGIDELIKLEKGLERHDVYYESYKDAVRLEEKTKRAKFGQDYVDCSEATIDLLKQINSSDTRPFPSEKRIVDKIYQTAYGIIKMEVLATGNSKVLDWVRTDDTAKSNIVHLIRKDLEALKKAGKGGLVQELLGDISSFDVNSNSLNEELILFLALQDKKTRKKVDTALTEIMQELLSKKTSLDDMRGNIENVKQLLVAVKADIKRSRIYKDIGIMLSLIAILLASKYGIDKAVPKIGHKEYKTEVEYFTPTVGRNAPTFPEYMKKINGFESFTLTAYGPWVRQNVFYGDYERSIVIYDLSQQNVGNVDDVMNLDFSKLSPSTDKETRSELDPSELYADAIVDIVRLRQDSSDEHFVPNEEAQVIVNVIATTLLCLFGCLGGGLTIRSVVRKQKEKFSYKKTRVNLDGELVDLLNNYRKLCEQNEHFRTRFIHMYGKVSKYYNNSNLEKGYEEIKRLDFTPLEK